MTRHALPVAAPAGALARAIARGPSPDALHRVTGSPAPARLIRVHFPNRRPLQLVYVQGNAMVLAELHGPDCAAQTERLRASLGKTRRGLAWALDEGAVVADAASGLVLRRPGLDARLPGLRLLHDPTAAREMLRRIEGRDPGQVSVTLVAHRLGKRAVLRLAGQDGRVRYARLRTDKSRSGAAAFGRHRALWDLLRDAPALRIPEPLGQDARNSAALFAELPGAPPNVAGPEGVRACRATGQAIRSLAGLSLHGLPIHDGTAEARLLTGWLARLHAVFPDRSGPLAPAIAKVCADLTHAGAPHVSCHRDLHEKQVLLDGDRAGLLDFDTLCLGHPAMDAGNMMAHLFLMGLTTGHNPAPFETAIASAIGHVPGRDLRLWRRAALLRLTMIHAFTDMPRGVWGALQAEAQVPHD